MDNLSSDDAVKFVTYERELGEGYGHWRVHEKESVTLADYKFAEENASSREATLHKGKVVQRLVAVKKIDYNNRFWAITQLPVDFAFVETVRSANSLNQVIPRITKFLDDGLKIDLDGVRYACMAHADRWQYRGESGHLYWEDIAPGFEPAIQIKEYVDNLLEFLLTRVTLPASGKDQIAALEKLQAFLEGPGVEMLMQGAQKKSLEDLNTVPVKKALVGLQLPKTAAKLEALFAAARAALKEEQLKMPAEIPEEKDDAAGPGVFSADGAKAGKHPEPSAGDEGWEKWEILDAEEDEVNDGEGGGYKGGRATAHSSKGTWSTGSASWTAGLIARLGGRGASSKSAGVQQPVVNNNDDGGGQRLQ